jgi:hypothetical protein
MKAGLVLLVLGVPALGAASESSPSGCTPVGRLPFRIDAPGHYCLQSNLVWPTGVDVRPGAAAIEVAADDVRLDLCGFRLLGPGGKGRLDGIQAWNRERITIRNGRVAGFFVGVALRESGRAPFGPRGHVVEGLRVSRQRWRGRLGAGGRKPRRGQRRGRHRRPGRRGDRGRGRWPGGGRKRRVRRVR